jgi:hypothetical protein
MAIAAVLIVVLVLGAGVFVAAAGNLNLISQRVFEHESTVIINPPAPADIQGRIISETSGPIVSGPTLKEPTVFEMVCGIKNNGNGINWATVIPITGDGINGWNQALDGEDFTYGVPFPVRPGAERISKFTFYPEYGYKGQAKIKLAVDQVKFGVLVLRDKETPVFAKIKPGNKNVPFTMIDIFSGEEHSQINSITVTRSGGQDSDLELVYLYEGTSLLGQAKMIGGNAKFNLKQPLPILANSQKVIGITADVSGNATNCTMNLGINSGDVLGITASGQDIASTDCWSAWGNSMQIGNP